MKMKPFLLMSLAMILTVGVALTSCKDDDDCPTPAPVIPPDPSGQDSVELVVRVSAEDTIRDIPASGQMVTIEVEANTDYSFKMSEWVSLAAAPAAAEPELAKSHITLSIAPNQGMEDRQSEVLIQQGEEVIKRIVLIQKGVGKITTVDIVSIDDHAVVNIASTGGMLMVNVESNVDYNFTMMQWAKTANQPQAAGVPTGSMLFMIEPNLTFSAREAEVIVEQADGTFSKTFMVHQEAISVEVQVGELDADGGKLPFTVVKDEGVELSYVTPPGLEILFGNPDTLLVSPNPTLEELKWPVMMTIHTGGVAVQKSFIVMQKPQSRIGVEYPGGGSNFELDSKGGEVVVKLTNLAGNGYVIDFGKEEGLSVKDQQAEQFTLVYGPNRPNANIRTGYFKVSREDNPGNFVEISFQQAINVIEVTHKWFCAAVPLPENIGNGAEQLTVLEIADFAPSDVQFEYEIPAGADWITNATWAGTGSMKVQRRNEDGTLMFDSNGQPVYYMVVDYTADPPARDSTRWSVYSLNVDIAENATGAERSADITVKMYNYNKTKVLETKTVTITQPVKKTTSKVTIISVSTNRLVEQGQGAPCRIELSGASSYEIYTSGGFSAKNFIEIVQNTSSQIQIFKAGNGPSGDFYIVPAGEPFDSANIENYGKVTLNL